MYELKRENILQRQKALADCLNRASASGVNAGSVLLVLDREGEICCLESGYAGLAAGKPMKRNGIFRCYSMTKPVTACAAMMLIQDGKLDMYEPVSRYIGSFRNQWVLTTEGNTVPAERECLVRDLLDMTAGLAYDGDETLPQRETKAVFADAEQRFDSDHPMSTQEFASRIGGIPLLFHPGSRWNYSVCADVLGAVIEKAADMPFADFTDQRILRPLGMTDSGFSVAESGRDRLVTAYEHGENGLVPYTGNHLAIRNDGRINAFHSGGAGLFSTAEDYARFARMLMNGGEGILHESTVRWMTGRRQTGAVQESIVRNIGMEGRSYASLMRVTVDPAAAFVPMNQGEYGWDGWLSTFFINDPATGLTILLMTNQKDGDGTLISRIRSILYLS